MSKLLDKLFGSRTRARRDLLTSAANLPIDDEWAYTIAYHAMLRAGRALLIRFNQMRTKRHAFIYEAEKPISRTEAEKSLRSAQEFVDEIANRVKALI